MKRTSIVLVTTGLLIAALCGCGGGDPAAATEDGADGAQAGAKAPEEMTPAEIGEEVGAVYLEAMDEVAAAVAERPEPEVLRPRLETLKEGYVQRLVELGRARQALGTADRATVDSKARMAVNRVPSETFTTYAEGQNYYLSRDRELADLIASFNVLTQYAMFELLEKQEPEEAERLGVSS